MSAGRRLRAACDPYSTPGVWPAIWLAVFAAIYGCVPETGHLPLVGGIAVGIFALEVGTRTRLPWVVHLSIVTVLVFAVEYGAAGHERALAGGAFAFWPAVIVPLATVAWPAVLARPEPVRWVVAALGGAASLIVSRTGALEPGWEPALTSIAVWAPASLLAAVVAVSALRP